MFYKKQTKRGQRRRSLTIFALLMSISSCLLFGFLFSFLSCSETNLNDVAEGRLLPPACKLYKNLYSPTNFWGEGSSDKPYYLCLPEHIGLIGDTGDKHYALVTDIDLGGATIDQIGGGCGSSDAFDGYFDGRGHRIFNFKVRVGDSLFGCENNVKNVEFVEFVYDEPPASFFKAARDLTAYIREQTDSDLDKYASLTDEAAYEEACGVYPGELRGTFDRYEEIIQVALMSTLTFVGHDDRVRGLLGSEVICQPAMGMPPVRISSLSEASNTSPFPGYYKDCSGTYEVINTRADAGTMDGMGVLITDPMNSDYEPDNGTFAGAVYQLKNLSGTWQRMLPDSALMGTTYGIATAFVEGPQLNWATRRVEDVSLAGPMVDTGTETYMTVYYPGLVSRPIPDPGGLDSERTYVRYPAGPNLSSTIVTDGLFAGLCEVTTYTLRLINGRQWHDNSNSEFGGTCGANCSAAGTYSEHIQESGGAIREQAEAVMEIEGIVAGFEAGGSFTCDGTTYTASTMTIFQAATCAEYMDDRISAFRRRLRRDTADNNFYYESESSGAHSRVLVEDHNDIGSRVDEYRDRVDEIFRNTPETTGVYTNL